MWAKVKDVFWKTPPSGVLEVTPFSERTLRKKRLYTSMNTPGEILSELEQVREQDEVSEAQGPVWRRRSSQACLVAMASMLLMLFPPVTIYAVGLFVLAAATAIYCQQRADWMQKSDTQNCLYETAHETLRFLSRDMSEERLMEAAVDFNHYHSRKYVVEKPGWFDLFTRTWKYVVPLISLKGRLLDGTRFRIKVTRITKRKEKSKKRSKRITERFNERIELQLTVRPRNVSVLPAAGELVRTEFSGQQPGLRELTVEGNKLTVETNSAFSLDINQQLTDHHQILGLLLACYDSIGRAAARAKSKSAA